MTEKLRILVIGAHPADIFDQSGGTMAHHAKRGDWVGALILTNGARIHDEVVASKLYKSKEIPQGEALEKILAERGDVKSGKSCTPAKSSGWPATTCTSWASTTACSSWNGNPSSGSRA